MNGCLMVQVAAKESLEALRLADRPGSGLVFSGAGAIEAVHTAHRHGFARPMLTDRRRYAGAARVRGTARLTPAWMAGQRSANVATVLTDSGYVGDGDLDALRAILRQAAEAGPDVTAVLPLHAHWLLKDRKTLIAEVVNHGVPVALVLEHHRDPLASARAVTGLIELLAAVPSAALLGTGVGALAALAFCAQWAAVGVRRSLRELRPVAGDEGNAAKKGRWHPAPPEIIAAPVLSFAPVPAVVRAYAATPNNPAWACRCSCCRGRTPQWLASAPVFDAHGHTFGVLHGEADRLRGLDAGPPREHAWRERCRQAVDSYRELGLAALGWHPPHFTAAWAAWPAAGGARRRAPRRAGAAQRGTGLRSAG